MEFGLKMIKLFLVFTLLVTQGLSQPIERSTPIDQQLNSTFLTNLKLGLENLLELEERLETDPKPGKYQSLFSNWVQNILYYSSSFEFNFWTTNVSLV